MGRHTFKTISDMEQYYYGYGAYEVMKTEYPMLSDTAGVYNAIYGKKVWSWLNQEANAWSVLPKKPWDQSGWRALTARAAASGGGISEDAAVPDKIKPTYAELSTKPKQIVHTFGTSEIVDTLAQSDDAIEFEQLRKDMGIHHAEMLNVDLMTQNGTLAGYGLESIDRVVSSYSEKANCKENDQSTGYTTGDLDIYAQDRDASTTADSYVNHNSSSNRPLTLDLIDTLIENVEKNAPPDAGQRIFLTGLDTRRKWDSLLQGQQRFWEVQALQVGVGGVQTVPGAKTGFRVASYNGIPVIATKNCVYETNTNGMSRLYLLDLNHIHIAVAKPTQYFQAGMNDNNPWGPDFIGNEGLYRTQAELRCTCFKAHGKIRDLSTV